MSAARRYIVGYAVFLVLLDLSVLLPGNPHTTFWGFVGAVALQTLIVWRLWNRSQFLWIVALALALMSVLFTLLAQASMNAGLVLFTGFSLVQAALLCTREVRSFIWSRPSLP